MKKMKLATSSLTLVLAAAGFVAAGTGTAEAADLTFGPIVNPPGFYNGSGNANEKFTIDTEGSIEVALRAKARDPGDLGLINASKGYYRVLGGSFSDPSHPTWAPMAMWNYDFSVNVGSGNNLTNYRAEITVNSNTFDNLYTHWADNTYWNLTTGKRSDHGSVPQPGDFGVQNSENPRFGDSGFGYVPGPGLYDIRLSLFSSTGGPALASTSMQVQVVPEPETYAMMATGLAVLGFIGRRRKLKVAAGS